MTSPLKGAGLMILATSLIALSTLQAKTLGVGMDALSPFQVTWGRYVFGLLGVAAIVLWKKPVLTPPRWSLHAVRIGCGWLGVSAMFAAATMIPLADTTAISFTNPIFAMLLAIPLLAERIGPIRWGTAGLALFGAVLLIRPGTEAFQPAALLALAAAMLFGMEVVMLKKLSGLEGTLQVVLIANVVGAVLSTIAVVFVWAGPTPGQWLLLAGTGFAMVGAQGLFTTALKQGDASFILPFSYAALLFAALYDFALFGVVPVWLSFVGGALIVISGIVLAWRDGAKGRARVPIRPAA